MVVRVLLAALVTLALLASPASAVAPPPLELIGGEGGLQVATSITVSPNGAHAYATAADSNAVVVFARDATTGDLTFSSCVNEDGTGGCTDGKALTGARSVVVSPNGAHVYVSSGDSDAVAVFTRNSSTGALTQSSTTSGCISETGSSGQCVNGRALDDAATMIISPDGANLYVGSAVLGDDTVAVLNRNSSTGAISQASDATGCISETGTDGTTAGGCTDGHALGTPRTLAISPDGENVYVSALTGDALAVLDRNTTTGVLTQASDSTGCACNASGGALRVLNGARGVTVSPDGENVYVASETADGVAVFTRNATTGHLTQPSGAAGCVTNTGSESCTDGKALDGAGGVAVSADNENVYVTAGFDTDAVSVFVRNTTTGALTQTPGPSGCISETGSSGNCIDGSGLDGVTMITTPTNTPDHAYTASLTSNGVSAWRRHPDEDFDGAGEPGDNCPGLVNVDQLDTNADGQGNACDPDDDGDGRADGTDNCPVNANTNQVDTDSDAQGDACDTDDDNDGDPDTADNCSLLANSDQLNTDGDDRGNACDGDDDNDTRLDAQDNCPVDVNTDQLNTDGDAHGNACDGDDDNDGDVDTKDNCSVVSNPGQENLEGDTLGDACDPDDDNDNAADTADNCPRDVNADQTNLDGDGSGDVCDADDDGDGASDGEDNCARVANPGGANLDGDPLGDACDPDVDEDGVVNTADNCERDRNTGQDDADGSGGGDVCDADDDDDGISDSDEESAGTSALDLDSDDDGIPDSSELTTSARDSDSDNDRIKDGTESGLTGGVADPPGPIRGTNPERFEPDADPRTKTKPDVADTDRDGLKDGREDANRDGKFQKKRETNPLKKDTDRDGVSDKRDRAPRNPRRR